MKNTKGISIFILSSFIVFGVFVSFFSGTHTAYACYCYPNLAVYPNGNDPHCINHVGDATYCSANTISATPGTSGIAGSGSSFVCKLPSSVTDFKGLIENFIIGCFYSLTVRIIIGLGIIMFFWGVFKFVRTDSETEKASGKQFILWGLIGIFVMVSIMGIVGVLQSSFNNSLNNTGNSINKPS